MTTDNVEIHISYHLFMTIVFSFTARLNCSTDRITNGCTWPAMSLNNYYYYLCTSTIELICYIVTYLYISHETPTTQTTHLPTSKNSVAMASQKPLHHASVYALTLDMTLKKAIPESIKLSQNLSVFLNHNESQDNACTNTL